MTHDLSSHIIIALTSVFTTVLSLNADYIGCYHDRESNRAFPIAHGYHHTLDECHQACMEYRYFALQKNSYCFCGDSLTRSKEYGESDDCNGLLGGDYLNSVFEHFYKYLGCYEDTSTRALVEGPHRRLSSDRLENCAKTCCPFDYFALQAGGWCSCSNSLSQATRYGESDGCPDDRRGGNWANDLFTYTETGNGNSINMCWIWDANAPPLLDQPEYRTFKYYNVGVMFIVSAGVLFGCCAYYCLKKTQSVYQRVKDMDSDHDPDDFTVNESECQP
eukprot:79589_1